MNKNFQNEMENSEFSQMINDAVNTDDHNNQLFYSTPLFSDYGEYYSNISISVFRALANKGFFTKIVEEKDDDNDRTLYQYFSKDGIEIFNVTKVDSCYCFNEFNYVFKGEQKLIDEYRYDIQTLIDFIIVESESE
jgi:hypothetical protein